MENFKISIQNTSQLTEQKIRDGFFKNGDIKCEEARNDFIEIVQWHTKAEEIRTEEEEKWIDSGKQKIEANF